MELHRKLVVERIRQEAGRDKQWDVRWPEGKPGKRKKKEGRRAICMVHYRETVVARAFYHSYMCIYKIKPHRTCGSGGWRL